MQNWWKVKWASLKSQALPSKIVFWGTIILTSIPAFILGVSIRDSGWTGFGHGQTISETIERDAKGNVVKIIEVTKQDSAKTLWDWISVLGSPAAIVILGAILQSLQQQQARKLEERDKAEAERRQEQDKQETLRQQKQVEESNKEDILQSYFDRISMLLVDKNILAIATKISKEEEERELLNSTVSTIRARTLSILRRFKDDKELKTSVLLFLIETEIIGKVAPDLIGDNIREVYLAGADLKKANLRGANLKHAILEGANLTGANLEHAILEGANLKHAILEGANLKHAILEGANLEHASLAGANLEHASLAKAILRQACLDCAKLEGAVLNSALLSGASLYKATLSDAYAQCAGFDRARLSEAVLSNSDFKDASFAGTNLMFANLSGADLGGVKFIQTKFLFTNLSGADLRDAYFQEVNLGKTDIRKIFADQATFNQVTGISREDKINLINQGAKIL